MRILICDDDTAITEQLNKYLLEYFSIKKLAPPEIVIFHDGETLLTDEGEKDIVFLDIEMPGVSGIYTGKELKKKHPNAIVFILTSFIEYLDEAMRFQVFRYLWKPLDKMRLFRNMKDALQLYTAATTKIVIETRDGVYSVPAMSIVCVEAQGRKVFVRTTKQDYESIHTIQYWAEKLTMHCFFRCHRSFIVNFEHVTDFDHFLIHLYHDQFTAYLTRRKYNEFKSAYLLYLESTN